MNLDFPEGLRTLEWDVLEQQGMARSRNRRSLEIFKNSKKDFENYMIPNLFNNEKFENNDFLNYFCQLNHSRLNIFLLK
jgi:hypothetical protein